MYLEKIPKSEYLTATSTTQTCCVSQWVRIKMRKEGKVITQSTDWRNKSVSVSVCLTLQQHIRYVHSNDLHESRGSKHFVRTSFYPPMYVVSFYVSDFVLFFELWMVFCITRLGLVELTTRLLSISALNVHGKRNRKNRWTSMCDEEFQIESS